MDGVGRDHESFSCFDDACGLTVHAQLKFPLEHIAQFLAGMRMASDKNAGVEFNTRLYTHPAGHAQFMRLQSHAGNARFLGRNQAHQTRPHDANQQC